MVALFAGLSAQAAQYWWAGNATTLGGTGAWNTTSNCWGTLAAGPYNQQWLNDGSTEAVFTNAGGTVTLGATPIKVNAMTFLGNAQTWNFNSGTLDFGNGSTSVGITNNDIVKIYSGITGSGTITFTTPNSGWQAGVTLYGNNSNTFNGKLVFRRTAGNYFWLFATNDCNFGAVPASYTADSLTFDSSQLENNSGSTLNIATNRGITVANTPWFLPTGPINFNSIITGNSAIRFCGGTNNLNNLNTYSGQTLPYGGYIGIGIDNALPHGAGKANLSYYSSGTVDLKGHVLTVNGIDHYSGILGVVDNSAAGSASLIVGDNNGGGTFYGYIKNTGGALSLTKIGTGTQTLSFTNNSYNSYAGNTTVNAGTLSITGTNRFGADVIVNNGGTLSVAGLMTATNVTVNSGGTLSVPGLMTVYSNVTVNSGTFYMAGLMAATNVTITGGALPATGLMTATNVTVNGGVTLNGIFTAASNLTVNAGPLIITGTNTYGGAIMVNSGTLSVTGLLAAASATVSNGGTMTVVGSFSNAAPLTVYDGGTINADLRVNTNGVYNSASTLTMYGGTFNVNGAGSSTNSSQTLADPKFAAALNNIIVTNRGGPTTLTLGNNWTRSPGAVLIATLNPGVGGATTLSSTPTLQNGILGYAFVRDNVGFDFATTSGVNIVRYTGATLLDATVAKSNMSATVNYHLDTNLTLQWSGPTQTVNSLRLNQANLNLESGKTLIVGSGGIISTNTTTAAELSGGTITAGGSELVFYAVGTIRTYSSTIADNPDGHAVGVTLAGGTMRYWGNLGGACTYSGDTVINNGATLLYGGKPMVPYGFGKGNVLVNAGGTWNLADGDGFINGLSQSTNNPGGSVTSWGGHSLTLGNNNATASFSGSIASSLTLIKVGTGTQTLSGINTYSGGTVLSNGVLSVSSDNNLGTAGSNVTFAGGTLMITGTTLTNLSSRNVNWNNFNGGLAISDAGNTFTVTNAISGIGALTKSGAGTLVLSAANTYAGGTTISNGTLRVACNNAIPGNGTVTVAAGATLDLAGFTQTFSNLTVAGSITNTAGGSPLLTVSGVLSPAGPGAIGQMTLPNNLALSGTLEVDAALNGTSDLLVTQGTLDLTGARMTVVNTNLLDISKQYVVLAYSNNPTGSFSDSSLPPRWTIKNDTLNKQILLRRANSGFIMTLQ